jgi:hypothetical protein
MPWHVLKRLITNSAVAWSPIWLSLVPTIASIIHALDGSGGISLQLPMRLELLYCSALAFLLARIFFFLGCPHAIRDFDSYEDFLKSGRPRQFIAHLLEPVLAKESNDPVRLMTSGFAKQFPFNHSGIEEDHAAVISRGQQIMVSVTADKAKLAFWEVVRIVDNSFRLRRTTVAACLIVGGIFIIAVMISGFMEVFRFRG